MRRPPAAQPAAGRWPGSSGPRSGAGLYAASFRRGAALARGGSTGAPLYDFFMGRELNPRLGGLDLKEFCELYPGLLGWLLIDLGMAHKQLQARARAGGRRGGRLTACSRDAPALGALQHLWFSSSCWLCLDPPFGLAQRQPGHFAQTAAAAPCSPASSC